MSPVRLNHAVLFISDLDRSVDFYTGLFSMGVVTRDDVSRTAFLRLPDSGNHHDLGLFEVRDADSSSRGEIGLYHLAWQVNTIDELVEFRQRLTGSGYFAGESDHGATLSVYGSDPDRNDFEIVWMLPRASWGDYVDAAPVNYLDLNAQVARWSGVATAAELDAIPGNL